ncbi:serine hydrolase [Mucilaginibacter sp. dw_454]|uniref:serine hydrolase domain-containing protein n=1 Tax=Mucilaginibacter sp. dw_454 TaxID=2720079 RepID=UPI001BD5E29A|nr:serine hydrolase [Mucilaginibacter sp. dw_454]
MSIPRRDFLKTTAIGAAGLSLVPMLSQSLFATPAAFTFPRTSPEQQGISSSNILDFINAAEKDKLGLHSLMILRNGNVVAEGWWDPYKPDVNHVMHSLSKSFTSTAIGFAISEGLLSVEDNITKFFPDDLPANPAPYLADMKVKHLLTMTTGHDADTSGPMRKGNEVWTKVFLSTAVPHQPGTYFLYDTGATYMLSAIVTKVTGKKVFDYLTPRLFKPLEIENIYWEVSPQGINTGGWGLHIKTEDIAKLGTLYLQNGVWKGKQVLPVNWSATATTYKVPNTPVPGQDQSTSDWQQGYCYQFWRCRHDFFRGDGANGQFCIVSRDLKTVIALTSEVQDMQKTLNHVWDYLLPGIKPNPLPVDAAAQSALKQKLAALTLLPVKTAFGKAMQEQVSGKVYVIKDNASGISQASLTFTGDECALVLKDSQFEQKIACGLAQWKAGETSMPGAPKKNDPLQKVLAAGAWKDDSTFVIKLLYLDISMSDIITCRFEDKAITVSYLSGLTATTGGTKDSRPVLQGTV